MGAARLKHLTDLDRLNANLRATCPSCGHSCVYPRGQIIDYFHFKGWNGAWELVGARFRCDTCGHRGAKVSMEPVPLPPAPPPLIPISADERKQRARRERG